MEKFTLTVMAVQLQLPLDSFIILMLRKIRGAPVMENATRCLAVNPLLLYLSKEDSWAEGNGERHTAVPAGDPPELYIILVTWVVNQA